MIPRRLQPVLEERLRQAPVVVLTGARQVGKTTLALAVGKRLRAVYVDLESERDRAKLTAPELYLEGYLDRLVILDEVHRMPGLFPVLRSLVDRARRKGRKSGLYLLLGSVSPEVSRQAGESLAGRATYLELAPLDPLEVGPEELERLWLRGGFPESFLAPSDAQSLRWRQDFLRTYLEREIPALGGRLPAETLRRFLTMLAHLQGETLHLSRLAGNLGLDGRTVGRYLDHLVDLYLLRRLPPYEANVGKRLVKSPKLYLRDSGLVHALLGIPHRESLLGHPVVGASWEGFVVENLLRVAPEGVLGFFYRTHAGAEIDLLLLFPSGALWAIEVKRSLEPKPSRGFHEALADLKPQAAFVVYPGEEAYPVAPGIRATPLPELMRNLWHLATQGGTSFPGKAE
ncbi:ATPase [Thermus scotoductus]|uniref:ATPase n=1 Tax=Thermus scotoductus TaxID=37636 RepID=A0A430SD72_THESC|nr:ATP-binding protein [Thermus scotoductus]RTH34517.1 ATPase [Thermus scotoductus]